MLIVTDTKIFPEIIPHLQHDVFPYSMEKIL